ncbi:MAG: DUF1054 family protein [Thermaerobacter sp.]|nr:DUF1054 family protein [Thermaerobacter sp.]
MPAAPVAASPADRFRGLPVAAFEVFQIAGFDARMAALRREATPRLAALGQELLPALSRRWGMPAHAHVAHHLRRRVNPPEDTWVAWSTSARGYKAEVHFEVGLSRTSAFVRLAALPEAGPVKLALLNQLTPERLTTLTAGTQLVRFTPDHHGLEQVPVGELTADWGHWVRQASRAQHGWALVVDVPRAAVVRRRGAWALDVLAAMDQLSPVWALSRPRGQDGLAP